MRLSRILFVLFTVIFVASFPLDQPIGYSRAEARQNGSANASNRTANQLPTPGADPPGTIDGSKNPELIPDDVAYRLVLLALAGPENTTDAQKARFQAKIAPAGLDEDDTEAFLRILGHLQTQLDDLRAQEKPIFARNPIPHPDSVGAAKLAELSQQRESVLAEAISALPARLSLAGAAKLHDFIQKEKRGMKFAPDIPMRPH